MGSVAPRRSAPSAIVVDADGDEDGIDGGGFDGFSDGRERGEGSEGRAAAVDGQAAPQLPGGSRDDPMVVESNGPPEQVQQQAKAAPRGKEQRSRGDACGDGEQEDDKVDGQGVYGASSAPGGEDDPAEDAEVAALGMQATPLADGGNGSGDDGDAVSSTEKLVATPRMTSLQQLAAARPFTPLTEQLLAPLGLGGSPW